MIKRRFIGMTVLLLGVAIMAIIPEEFPAIKAWELAHPPAHTICIVLGLLLLVAGIVLGAWASADKPSSEAVDCIGRNSTPEP